MTDHSTPLGHFIDALPGGPWTILVVGIVVLLAAVARYGPPILEAWKRFRTPPPAAPWMVVETDDDGRVTKMRAGHGTEPRDTEDEEAA